MNQLKKSRIKDVAAQAGVSMMTVSRVLNNDKNVSFLTREKVLLAVKALNYRPNVSARRLASSKSYFIGLLYDNPSASYVSQFLLSALKKCRESGYHLIIDEIENDNLHSLDAVNKLIHITQVDGIILLPPICNNSNILGLLEEKKIPYLRISPDVQLNLSPYICIDDYQAAFEVTEHLIANGHRKIAHIVGDEKQGVSRLRYQGYLDALRTHNITAMPEYKIQGAFTYKSGFIATQKLLSLKHRPSAIFAANDDMAAAAIAAAHKTGVDVPAELAVVGFDDTQLATTIWPNISTVRQPINDMAELAIELLSSGKFNQSNQLKFEELRNVLDFSLIIRDSSEGSIIN